MYPHFRISSAAVNSPRKELLTVLFALRASSSLLRVYRAILIKPSWASSWLLFLRRVLALIFLALCDRLALFEQWWSDHRGRRTGVAGPFQNLYPFSTQWAIAFSRVFGYTHSDRT